MARRIPDKLKSVFSDTVWSVAGLVLMNIAAQFVVYPYWDRALGSEAYGNIVFLLAVMNVLSISVGAGVNYTRMRRSADRETANTPYLLLMAAGSMISVVFLSLLYALGLLQLAVPDFILFCVLSVLTMWRYYADVEYRLHINYKGYFLYYLIIGLGYLVGILLFKAVGFWPLALLPGELAGLLFVLWKGSIFRKDRSAGETNLSPILRLALMLVGTNALSHLIFNGDRIILQFFAGSAAVTAYYVASLFGKTMTLITTPLNGVLVGYLAKYDGRVTKKLMTGATAASVAAIVAATAICAAASRIILPFLYPADFPAVKQYLLLANAAQVIYFIGNVLTASVLLRFTPARNQVIVNVAHGILFAAVCVPAAWKLGIGGFCWGLFAVNSIRCLLCVALGYSGIVERNSNEDS